MTCPDGYIKIKGRSVTSHASGGENICLSKREPPGRWPLAVVAGFDAKGAKAFAALKAGATATPDDIVETWRASCALRRGELHSTGKIQKFGACKLASGSATAIDA